MRPTYRHVATILAIAFVMLFVSLGNTRLWDRDEPRNAGCALEMLERHDYIVPMFNHELRTHKPVLLYWLIMPAYKLFGVNEFAARLPSALLALGTALCTYAMARRLFNPAVGLWSAIVLLSCLMFEVAAHAATPDSVLIFFCTSAITAFVLGTARDKNANAATEDVANDERFATIDRTVWQQSLPFSVAVLMYTLLGFAVLAKGPVGLILPTAVLGMFLLLMRLPETNVPQTWSQRIVYCLRPFAPLHFLKTCWAMRPITAIVCALTVALPWYVWVGLRTNGDFLFGFLFEHNLARATQTFEGHRGSALVFYPVAILMGFFPWSVFAGPSVMEVVGRIRKAGTGNVGLIFCACWAVVWVGAFSCASTKLPSYVTPCYPALAMATAVFLNNWFRGVSLASPIWPKLSLASLITVGVVISVAFVIVAQRYLPGEEMIALLGLVPIAAGAGTWFFLSRNQRVLAQWSLAGGAVLLLSAFYGYVLVRADHHQESHLILQAIHNHSESPEVASYDCLESTWVYYGRFPIRELESSHVQRVTKPHPVSRFVAVKNVTRKMEVEEFLSAGPERFVITTRRRYEQLQPYLPAGTQVLAEARYFLKDEKLVVLGQSGRNIPVARPQSNATVR